MSHPEEYDVVVLGSGAPGKRLAWTLASQGKRLAVIERRYVGGSCPNVACLPSKNVIHGAKVDSYFRRGAEFGIATGDWKVDMAAVRDRKRKMVDGLVALHQALIEQGGDRILGFTAFGVEAGEIMAIVQIAMLGGIPYTAIRDTVITHPTMAEGLGDLLSSVARG